MVGIALKIIALAIFAVCIKLYIKKKVLYDACRKKLVSRLNVLRSKAIAMHNAEESEEDLRNNLVLPFFQVLEYDTMNACEFTINENPSVTDVDYTITRWNSKDYSHKAFIQVKFAELFPEMIDYNKNIFIGNKVIKAYLDNFIVYSDCVYTILTNGYTYLFFKNNADEFVFSFNLLNYRKSDLDFLALMTKEYLFSDFWANNDSLTIIDTMNDQEILNKIMDFFIRDFLHPQTVAIEERIREEMPYLPNFTIKNLCKYLQSVTKSIYNYVQKNYDEKLKRTMLEKEEIEKWITDKYPWVSKTNLERAYFNGLYFFRQN